MISLSSDIESKYSFEMIGNISSKLKKEKRKPMLARVLNAKILGQSDVILNNESNAGLETIVFNPKNQDKVFKSETSRFSHIKEGIYTYTGIDNKKIIKAIFIGTHLNFGHWLFNHLARFVYVEKKYSKWSIIISSNAPQSHIDCLSYFGVSKNRIIFLEQGYIYNAEELIIPMMPYHALTDGYCWWAPNIINFMRESFGINLDEQNGTKLIFLTRKNARWRRLINENLIFEILQPLGFNLIDPGKISIVEQIKLAKNAKVVISPFGAGSNICLFMNSSAKFIELAPPLDSMDNTGIFAKKCGLDYVRIIGLVHPQTGQTTLNSDYSIEVDQILQALKN